MPDEAPQRIFSPHTGTDEFKDFEFPELPEGMVWRLDISAWLEDGVWWEQVKAPAKIG